MKKSIARASVAAGLLLAGSFNAGATIAVNWFTFGTIYLNDGTTPFPVGSIAQLIWSPDNTISPFTAGDPLTPDSSEVLLLQIATPDAGCIYYGVQDYIEADYGIGDTNYFVGGYVYTRVYDYPSASGIPTNGTWYGAGPTIADGPIGSQHGAGSPPEPTQIDITGGLDSSFTLSESLVIPEPTTVTMMGLGLLTMASQCFRKKHKRR